MRCPKCHYISFDNGDRCRNCGYEFALAVEAEDVDLPIQTGDEAIGPLSDFNLSDLDKPSTWPEATASSAPPGDGVTASPATVPPPRPITSSFDLPLFHDRGAGGDAPLVTPPAVPRPPLAVRRSSPAGIRTAPRVHVDEPELDLSGPEPLPAAETAVERPSDGAAVSPSADLPPLAPAGPRLLAACVDGAIVGAVSLVVLYLTLKFCGLTFAQTALIPAAPFLSFLLLIAGGYFTLFVAASGQTIGKMAAGLKVVPADEAAGRVSLGRAVVRAAAYLVSALPAGLGFLPALVGADRRAIHDRLAATRVVKA